MTREVRYPLECQAKKMKEYIGDPLERICTQLKWNEPMLKDVIKVDKEDVVSDIVSNVMVVEFST